MDEICVNWNFLHSRSLKARVTFFTLAIFVISIWALTYYISHMLRVDMERELGEQQFSAVSVMAAGVNEDLADRLKGLENIAGRMNSGMLSNKVALQEFLDSQSVLQHMFSGGLIVLNRDGTAVAEAPLSAGRIGINYADSDHVAVTLKEGKSTIGRPIMGRKLHSPLFTIVTPIHGAQGKVIGALNGVLDLGKPNFLDKVTESRYGQTGGYLLIAPQHRLIVTATDKSRIMQPMPAPGVNPQIERYVQGAEGSAVYVNAVGVEILNSVKAVPVAGWYLAANLPTEEAFAPIRDMQRRIVVAAIIFTLLAGILTWWMLKRQLSTMMAAAKTLAAMTHSGETAKHLPITRQDEIGDLIGGFNHLLDTVGQREAALRESEHSLRLAERQMSISQQISRTGSWVYSLETNNIWGSAEGLRIFGFPAVAGDFPIDDIEACIPERDRVHQALVGLIDEGRAYDLEYAINPADGAPPKVIHSIAMRELDPQGNPLRVLGFIQDITEQKRVEGELVRHRENLETMVVERTVELRALAGELAMAEERERRSIARDLHDDLGQSLALIKLKLKSLTTPRGNDEDGDLIQLAQQISNTVDHANRSVRSLSLQLSPPALSQFGLVAALEWLADEMLRTHGLNVHIRDETSPLQLGKALSSSLYRTVRELLINAAKHAKVDKAEVSLFTDGDKLVVTVADAGIGFDVKLGLDPSTDGGYGLFSVRERLRAIGGEVQIDSLPGDGTLIVLTVPLDALTAWPGS
jgi:signal transduction histidine kinase